MPAIDSLHPVDEEKSVPESTVWKTIFLYVPSWHTFFIKDAPLLARANLGIGAVRKWSVC